MMVRIIKNKWGAEAPVNLKSNTMKNTLQIYNNYLNKQAF